MVNSSDQTQIVLRDYTRVAGTYELTYEVSHMNVSGYSIISVPITVTIRSNCDQAVLQAYTTVPILAYTTAASFNFVGLTSNMLSQPACIPMTLGSKLKFKLQGLLYGASQQTAVSSTTNAAYYRTPLGGFSGLDLISMNPSFTFNAETRVTYLVTAAYDTVDQTLAAWESTQKQFAFDVFKILPSSSEVLSALLSATPD